MKTYKQFRRDQLERLDEIAPLALGAALLGGAGKAYTAYSAYNALHNLSKGKYKQAGWDALGALPLGRLFGGATRLAGGGKFLQKAAGFGGGTARATIPSTANTQIDKGIDATLNATLGPAGSSKPKPTVAQPPKPSTPSLKPPPKPTPKPTIVAQQPKSSVPKPVTVLAKKGGVEGTLNKTTGKWTANNWSSAGRDRYNKLRGAAQLRRDAESLK